MEELNDDCIADFDKKYSSDKIRCLKVINTYLTPKIQNLLAVYIKFLEIRFCLGHLDNHIDFNEFINCRDKINIPALLDDIMPYLSSSEREKIKKIRQTFSSIEHYQSLFSTISMMQEIFGDGSDNPFSAFSPDMDMSELSSMMELFRDFKM